MFGLRILISIFCLVFLVPVRVQGASESLTGGGWTDESMLELPDKGWLLFPGKLLAADELTAERLADGVTVDRYVGLWSKIPGILPFSRGVVTYHLHLQIPGLAGHSVFLRSRDILRSARIFVNGVELIQAGKVAAREEDYVPSKAYIFQNFTADSDDLKLVVQIADYSGQSGGIWSPISLYGQVSGLYQMQMDLLGFSGVLVTTIFMSIYFSALYLLYRHRPTLLYVSLFLLSMGIFIFLSGDTRMIASLYESLGYSIHTRSEAAFTLISSATFLIFMRSLFPMDFPGLVNRIFVTTQLCLLMLVLFTPIVVVEQLRLFLGLPLLAQFLYVSVASIRALYYRRIGSKLWISGALIFLTTVALDFGKYQVLINYPNLSHLGLLVFTWVQAMVVIQQLSEDDRQKRHAYEQLAKVFYPHQLNKMIAGHILEDTMPQGTTEACVLCFDLVSSSSLEHGEARALFGEIFSACHEALMEGYDQEAMEANGYRIKEVGDGFYCSVGFPFATPQGRNSFDLALELAFRFVSIFEEIMQRRNVQRPLQCSIGLAFDTVEAYFADAGTKSYDIFGRAVILSNRYEDLRRTFFGKEMQVNVITVQEKVYHRLSVDHQASLKAFDISQQTFRIRDDAQARRFYYWAEPTRKSLGQDMDRAG